MKRISTMIMVQAAAGMLFCSMTFAAAARAQAVTYPAGPILGLTSGQISFSVDNIDSVSDWYVKLLGFKVVRTATPRPGFTLRTISIPGFAIDLVKMDGSALASWPYSRYMQRGYVHFALYTSDVLGALKVLQSANADVTPLKGANGEVNRLILHDPEGNELELFIPPKY